jgi:hypothetical protein
MSTHPTSVSLNEGGGFPEQDKKGQVPAFLPLGYSARLLQGNQPDSHFMVGIRGVGVSVLSYTDNHRTVPVNPRLQCGHRLIYSMSSAIG